jgi:hypothetical protein
VSSQPFTVPAVHRPHVRRPRVCRPCCLSSLLFVVPAVCRPCCSFPPFVIPAFIVPHSWSFPAVRRSHSLLFVVPIPRCSPFPAVLRSPPPSFPAIHHLSFVGLVPPVRRSLLFVIGAVRRRQHLHIPLRAVARRQVGGAV